MRHIGLAIKCDRFSLLNYLLGKNINTCPNACRQSARRTPSARSTGKFLLKSEPTVRGVIQKNKEDCLDYTKLCDNQLIVLNGYKPEFARQLWKNMPYSTVKIPSCL